MSDRRPKTFALMSVEEDRAQAERRVALQTPWPWKPWAYLLWLCEAMPERSGLILFVALCCCTAVLLLGLIIGLIVLANSDWSWLLWVACGAALALGGRGVLHDALTTERFYRRSTTRGEEED